MSPKVSIVMAAYNNAADLPRALDSIRGQTFREWELILIDDGSTDGSSDLMDRTAALDERIRVIHQLNTGLGPALKRGCEAARASLLARHDADDWSEPTRLERQIGFMEDHPQLVICGTWTRFFHDVYGVEYEVRLPDSDALNRRMLLAGINPFVHGSVMMRRQSYAKAGYRFRKVVEDFDLWLRMVELGRTGTLPSVEYNYRLSLGGIMSSGGHLNEPLVSLVLQLASERTNLGKEFTDWASEEQKILSRNRPVLTLGERQTNDAFHRGLMCLKRRDYQRCLEAMASAAGGVGRRVAAAKCICLLGKLGAPAARLILGALRRYLVFRNRKGMEPFIRYHLCGHPD